MTGWCDGSLVNAVCPMPATAGSDPASSGFAGLASAMASAFGQLLQALLGFWSRPDGVGALDAPGGLVSTVNTYTTTLVAATATLGVIIAGTRLAITSSRAQEPARDLARGLLVLALVAGGGAAAVQAVRSVLDDAADGLLTQGFDGTPIGSQLVALTDLQRSGISPGVTFLLGLLGALSTFAQFFVMVVRGPVLAVLVGVLPIAAASTMTGAGVGAMRRLVAWVTALTAYKFVAGLLYAAAFVAVGGTDGSAASAAAGDGRLTGVVTGIALIIVAVGALPALVRLLLPAAEAAVAVGAGSGEAIAPPSSGAVQLSGRGRQGVATGPPSDAGPHTGAGLVRGGTGHGGWGPTGSTVSGATRGRPTADGGTAARRPGADDADGPGADPHRPARRGPDPAAGPPGADGNGNGVGNGVGWPGPAAVGASPEEGR